MWGYLDVSGDTCGYVGILSKNVGVLGDEKYFDIFVGILSKNVGVLGDAEYFGIFVGILGDTW